MQTHSQEALGGHSHYRQTELQREQASDQRVRLGSIWQELHIRTLGAHEDLSDKQCVLSTGKDSSSRTENTSLSTAGSGLRK